MAYKSDLNGRPHCVYRAYIDGRLAYVGVTQNPRGRFAQHASAKAWWRRVDHIAEEWYDQRSRALRAEQLAIRDEAPLYNVARPEVHDA